LTKLEILVSPCALSRVAFAALLALCTLPSSAQLFRAYLTLDGNDANPCTLAAPCRLLPAGLAAVADGGEVWLLDSANYNTGPVNIAKSVTILAVPGAVGSIVGLGGNALTIATAGVKVKLRNLIVLPFPGSSQYQGIRITAGDRLVIEGCRVTGFNGDSFAAGLWAEFGGRVVVEGSVFSENFIGAAFLGGASAGTVAHVSGSHFDNNVNLGLYASSGVGTTRVAVIRSTASGNGNYGFAAQSVVNGAAAELSVVDSQAANNAIGVSSSSNTPGATALVTASGNQVFGNSNAGLYATGADALLVARGNTVTRNNYGMRNNGATFESAVDNAVRTNSFNSSGTITPFTGM
jgi:hypothetical protein